MKRRSSLERLTDIRAPKRKFIIYTEGKNTEPDYFSAVVMRWSGTLVDLEIVRAAGVPSTIADRALEHARRIQKKKKRGSLGSYEVDDVVWAVFDRDEHPDFLQSIHRCRAGSVGVAYSNPCFELWLILHKEDFDRSDHRHDVQRRLEEICSSYSRHRGKTLDYAELVQAVEEAERRAISQQERRHNEGDITASPCTTVQELTAALRTAHRHHTRKK